MSARLAGLIAALLAGCAVGPDYERPSQAAPAAWRTAPAATPALGEDLANLAWWTLFRDPVLDQLVAEALAGNRDLKIAAARIDEAAGLLTSTRAQLFPQLGAAAGAGRWRSATAGYRLADQYSASLGVSWEIDLFGRVRRASESAQAQVLASEEARSGLALTLAGAVANGYINLRDLDNELEIARRTLETREEALRIFELRYAGGVVSEMEVAQIRSEVETARITIPLLERDITVQENALAVLLGRMPGAIPRGKALAELAIPLPPPGLPSAVLERRPDIRQAEQNLIALNAQISVARAAYFPSISLTGLLGSVSTSYSALFSGPAKVWSYGADLTMPVFTAGAIGGQVQAADSARCRGWKPTARPSSKPSARSRMRWSARSRRARCSKRASGRSVYARSARLRYEGGYSSYLEVLDAERSLFQAQINASQARAQSLAVVTTLYKVLGGGWQAAGGTGAAIAGGPATNLNKSLIIYLELAVSSKSFATITNDLSVAMKTLRKEIPDTMQGFSAMHNGAMKGGALSELDKELLALAIGVAQHCDGCIGFHVKALIRLGVTREQLLETLGVCVYMGGGPSLMYAAEAVRAYEEFTAGK